MNSYLFVIVVIGSILVALKSILTSILSEMNIAKGMPDKEALQAAKKFTSIKSRIKTAKHKQEGEL